METTPIVKKLEKQYAKEIKNLDFKFEEGIDTLMLLVKRFLKPIRLFLLFLMLWEMKMVIPCR